jgi:hypothetical protein
MKKIVYLLMLNIMSVPAIASQRADTSKILYLQNRYPLQTKPYIALPLGNIKAKGWLLNQLEVMKKGMGGKLDELYPHVLGSRNGWLGGDGDVWERGPYWLDGLVPLAYILDDKELKAKAQKWIEWSLNNQMNDGILALYLPQRNPLLKQACKETGQGIGGLKW